MPTWSIVGGGYTGMWAAYFIHERWPDARIVLLEQDICGGGPSGRNGGFVHGWWESLGYLVERFGPDAGMEIAREADEVVDGIGAWCRKHRVDAHFVKAGYLRVNAFPSEPPDWEEAVERLRAAGVGDELEPVDAVGRPARLRLAGIPGRSCSCRALRRFSRRCSRGACAGSSSSAACGSSREPRSNRSGTTVGCWARTDGGVVAADQAVLAINAWAAGWPNLRSRVLAWGSYMVVTEPIPDRLAELGWTGGELLSDSRFTISYFRTTRDGRIAFGAGVGSAGYGGSMDGTFTDDRRAVERVVANFHHLFPMLRDVRLIDAWGGPIDITGHRFPEIASSHGGTIHFAHGFAGNGAGPSRLAGRILAALVVDPTDRLARLPIVGRRQPLLPPEPIRFIGARMVREALIRQDDQLDAGRRPAWYLRLIAQLPRLLGYRIGH